MSLEHLVESLPEQVAIVYQSFWSQLWSGGYLHLSRHSLPRILALVWSLAAWALLHVRGREKRMVDLLLALGGLLHLLLLYQTWSRGMLPPPARPPQPRLDPGRLPPLVPLPPLPERLRGRGRGHHPFRHLRAGG